MKTCCKCKNPLTEHRYGLHSDCFIKWFKVEATSKFSDIVPRSQSQSPLDSRGKNTSFFHGAFRKYSACLEKGHYILKVIQEEHPELQATEFLCNQIFELLGIRIPPFYLIRYPENQFCFVTMNFMTQQNNSSLIHIYHYIKNNDEYNFENILEIIGRMTGRRTEQERFAYLMLADSLIGNHDRHGRNLGFIQSPKGMSLSPFYDNPSYIGLNNDFMLGADLQPRGAIFTQHSNEPTTKDYVFELNRLGYEDVVKKFKKTCLIKKIDRLIEESVLSKKRKDAFSKLINWRHKEL